MVGQILRSASLDDHLWEIHEMLRNGMRGRGLEREKEVDVSKHCGGMQGCSKYIELFVVLAPRCRKARPSKSAVSRVRKSLKSSSNSRAGRATPSTQLEMHRRVVVQS